MLLSVYLLFGKIGPQEPVVNSATPLGCHLGMGSIRRSEVTSLFDNLEVTECQTRMIGLTFAKPRSLAEAALKSLRGAKMLPSLQRLVTDSSELLLCVYHATSILAEDT
jgi:hypothetical protein